MINQALAELGWGFRGCTEPTCGAQASCAQQEVRNCFQISEALPHPKQARPGSQHEPGALVPEHGHIRFHQGRAEIRGKGGALKVRDTHPSPRGACESDHTIEGKGGCWWPQGPPPPAPAFSWLCLLGTMESQEAWSSLQSGCSWMQEELEPNSRERQIWVREVRYFDVTLNQIKAFVLDSWKVSSSGW